MEKYDQMEKLGQGTYGVVFKGRNRETQENVALKMIRMDNILVGAPSAAFREIAILRELRHPNIVRLLESFMHDEKLVMVFEQCDQDLAKYFDDLIFEIDPKVVQSFTYQLLRGIEYCHRSNVIHRDLKPQNLLINNQKILKIADFGLARAFGLHDRLARQVATLWYRPPDVLFGATDYCTTIDIWSAGCIFGELANSGMPVFSASTDENQLRKIFMVLGTPTERDWPGVTALPNYREVGDYPPRRFRDDFPLLEEDGLDLLEKLLVCDPKGRLTARQAMEHNYFNDLDPEIRNEVQ